MQLFGDVNRHQEFLNQSSNFSNFGSSLMILMRMVTGESWNGVMCAPLPPPSTFSMCLVGAWPLVVGDLGGGRYTYVDTRAVGRGAASTRRPMCR